MCFDERYTLSRGRSAVPTSFLRTRQRLRWRVAVSRFCAFMTCTHTLLRSVAYRGSAAAGERLAFLAADHFVLVTDALALVRLGLAGGADLRGELPHLLLVR